MLIQLALAFAFAFAQDTTPPPPPPATAAEWTRSGDTKLEAGDTDAALMDYLKPIGLDAKHAPAWNDRAIVRQ